MDHNIYKEKVAHGSKDFPLEVHYSHYENAPQNVLYMHWHSEMELFYLEEGDIVMTVDHEEFELQPGDGIFINSNQLHSAAMAKKGPCSFYAIVFDSTFISPAGNDIIYYRYVEPVLNKRISFSNPITNGADCDILHALKQIIQQYDAKQEGFELDIKSTMFQIWKHIVLHSQKSAPYPEANHEQTKRIRTVLEYIHEHFDTKITLADLSETIHLSQGQFCRFFKGVLHKSPFTYINEYRISKSCMLLRHTDKYIAEIAMLSGFETISYFNKTFLKIMGCTPLSYRKQK